MMYRWLLMLVCLLGTTVLRAEGISPEQYFEQGKYNEAAQLYESKIREGKPDVADFYNLALCYQHLGQLPRAILSYERVLTLAPTSSEARHNLRLAYNALDAIPSSGHTLEVLDDIAYALDGQGLVALSFLFFALLLLCLAVFRLGSTLQRRKLAFYLAMASGGFWLFVNALLLHQWYYNQRNLHRAIVMEQTEVEDAQGVKYTLPAGSPAELLNQEGDKANIRLYDGRQGVISAKAIEAVVK